MWYDTTTRFFVDPQLGTISLIEIFGDKGSDPVEVYFDTYREVDCAGQQVLFPTRFRLQYGSEPFLYVNIENIDFGGESESPLIPAAGPGSADSTSRGQP
jgi:hypothetical protein